MDSPTISIPHGRRMRLLVASALVFLGILLRPADGRAQTFGVTSSGLNTTVKQTGTTWDISNGTRSGSNLFLSFGRFSIPGNGIANFNNTAGLATPGNVLGRVTGAEASTILGTIKTVGFPAGTDLFLINPNGVVLGPNATLDVSGSFHVSTADYLRLSDKLRFYADPSRDARSDSVVSKLGLPLFVSAPPDAFGFLTATPAAISVKGVTLLDPNGNAPPAGRVLSVVGGETPFATEPPPPLGEPATGLKITGAGPTSTTPTIRVASGRVEVVSVAAPGEVTFSPNLDVSSVPTLGRIDLSNGAHIVVDGSPGGSVVIRGGRLFASGGSSISASAAGTTSGAQPAVDLQVSGDVALSGLAGLQVLSSGSQKAGDIRITAGTVQMDTGAFINSTTVGGGGGADVMVNADHLTLNGGASISSGTQPPPPFRVPSGPGGRLTINAADVDIAGQGSKIVSSTGSTAKTGVGGAITITAPTVTLTDHATVATTASPTAIAAGGDIVIAATNFSLTGGAELKSSESNATSPLPTSRGGNVILTASGLATMSGMGSGIFSDALTSKTASAGDITVHAGTLVLTDSATIRNGFVQHEAGNITVTASDSIVMTSGASIVSQTFSKDVGQLVVSAPRLTMDNALIQASTVEQGNAGNITVTVAGDVVLTGGAQIATSSGQQGTGSGGNLTVDAGGSVSISGRSPSGQPVSTLLPSGVLAADADASSGLFSTGNRGNAGAVNIVTPTLTVANGAKISAATTGTGQGGDIDIHAGHLQLTDGGNVSATASGSGNAGNIALVIGNDVRLNNSSITTSASTADGGNISLTGGDLVYLLNSEITTSVGTGKGSGGNVTIDPQFVVLDHSQVRADAFGGPGGHIDILSDFFLTNASVLSASSALSTQGTVTIESQFTDVSSSVAPLPAGLARAATLLRAACAARVASGKASSLVVAGREGVPLEPGGYIPSPLMASASGGGGSPSTEIPDVNLPRFSLSVFAPTCLR